MRIAGVKLFARPRWATSTYSGSSTTMPGMNMIIRKTQNRTLPNLTGVLVKTNAASADDSVARITAGTTTMNECRMLDRNGTCENSVRKLSRLKWFGRPYGLSSNAVDERIEFSAMKISG